jgi:hypothetical protein
MKLLILDDALRPQAVTAGVPTIVCDAIKQWENEVLTPVVVHRCFNIHLPFLGAMSERAAWRFADALLG